MLVKIAPDLDEGGLEDILGVVEQVGLVGVVATNTTLARDGLRTPTGRLDAIGAGGLSGPPLRSRVLAAVRRIRARLGRRVVVVGVGGVETADQALDLVRAGADTGRSTTSFIYGGPFVASRIARDLAETLEREGVKNAADLVATDVAATGTGAHP